MFRFAVIALTAVTLVSIGAAQDAQPLAIELTNPGFEEGVSTWSIGNFAEQISADTEVAHSGADSVRISDATGASNAYLAQTAPDLEGSATYTLRAWFRGEALGTGATAALKIEAYTADGRNTLGRYARMSLADAGEWRQIEVTAKFPPEITRATLILRLFGRGTASFDDVEFVRISPPPVVTIGPERQLVASDQRTVTFTARLAETWDGTEPPIGIKVYEEADGEVEAEVTLQRVDARIFEATVSIPELAPGAYRVEVSLGQTPGDMARVFVPLPVRRPENLTDTGTILVGGEPFFPIGTYHCSPSHYPMLAEAGFNCVQGIGPGDLDRFGAALDACAENGLMMDVPLYANGQVAANVEASLAGIERYADHPAVLCWKIIDEPDIRPDVTDEVPQAYAALREADPAHPIELTLCRPPGFGYWANFCDIMQVDPYPIPRSPLTMVSDWADTAMAGLEPWQNLTVVLQSGWIPEPMNQPTPEQALCQVYLALIHGAKGLGWYSFRDPGWRLEETPLWEHFPAINAETLELSRPVMLGEAAPQVSVQSPDDVVHWRAWRHEGKTWLLLANPGEAPVTATVAPGGPCTVSDLRGEGLEEIDDGFEVELPAFGAQTRLLTAR